MTKRKFDNNKLPSRHVRVGPQKAPHRSYYYAMGLDEDDIDVFKYLSSNDIGSDMKIFKKYYLSKVVDGEMINLLCPIKFESYRKFYFWNGQKWIPDMDGYYISKTLADNLQRFYLRHNKTSSSDNMEKVFKNQEYINTMKTEKYKRLFVKELRAMINLDV